MGHPCFDERAYLSSERWRHPEHQLLEQAALTVFAAYHRDMPTTVAGLLATLPTTPILDCPGRYRVRDHDHADVAALVGPAVAVTRHAVAGARHPVLVARLPDGGVISYAWPDGRFVHTIGDVDGFARKLAQLGLP